MANKHAYVPSTGLLVQIVSQFRKSFPPSVTGATLKKLGLAPANEGPAINVLRFLSILDDKGERTAEAARVFNAHDDAEFQAGFSDMVKATYTDLFGLHGDEAWNLDSNKLISYFRITDGSTDLVGKRQAQTFQALAGLSGKTATPLKTPVRKLAASNGRRIKNNSESTPKTSVSATEDRGADSDVKPSIPIDSKKGRDVGLTVRIEINLPAGGDQDTYDRIFRSIRENLIDGE